MTKADLKTGMVVTCRNGDEYMVIKDLNVAIERHCGFMNLSSWTDDLKAYSIFDTTSNCFDVVKVTEIPHGAFGLLTEFFNDYKKFCERSEVIWERPEKKKYTYEQLKEILGEEFEIVKEV